jgi:arabinofuranosyltransferase
VPERRGLALYAGVGLYVLYVVRIGGDFMSGRFLTAPLFLAVTVLAVCGIPRSLGRLALALVVLLGVFTLRSPLWSSNMLTTFPNYPLLDRNGISDQRLFYFGNPNENQYNSFVENGFRNGDYGSAFAGEDWQFKAFKRVLVTRALGKIGYQEGPNIYVIDEFALADPLLARLPVVNRYWQIGHFYRDLPEGYMETLQSGSNQIVDPDLALYYDRLDVVIRGPLFSWERMREIWKFNTGGYDGLLERYNSRTER